MYTKGIYTVLASCDLNCLLSLYVDIFLNNFEDESPVSNTVPCMCVYNELGFTCLASCDLNCLLSLLLSFSAWRVLTWM